jgi:hypothetical protein
MFTGALNFNEALIESTPESVRIELDRAHFRQAQTSAAETWIEVSVGHPVQVKVGSSTRTVNRTGASHTLSDNDCQLSRITRTVEKRLKTPTRSIG